MTTSTEREMTDETRISGFQPPYLIVVGNDDGHAFFTKGLVDKLESTGGWAISIGDDAFCAPLQFRGSRGVGLTVVTDIADPEAYARSVWYAQRMAPPYIGIQCPPDRPEVYEAMLAALFGMFSVMMVVALPSKTESELFEKAARLADGLKIARESITVIYGTNVTDKFCAAA